MVDLPVSQKICQIFETTSHRLYIGSYQTCNSGCFPVQGLRGSKKYRPPCGFCLPSVKGCMNGMLISILGFLSHPKMQKMKFKKRRKKQTNRWFKVALFLIFYVEVTLPLKRTFQHTKKKTPRIARNIGSISIIFSFSGSMFFMVFLFDIFRLRLLAIDQRVVCTHILKEPWNPFKKIAKRQYHIHIIQHLWYLRNKKKCDSCWTTFYKDFKHGNQI